MDECLGEKQNRERILQLICLLVGKLLSAMYCTNDMSSLYGASR